MRTIYLLFIAAVISACAAVIVPTEKKYADDPVQKAARGEITPLGELSLIRAANAQRALDGVRERLPAEVVVQDVVLRPGRIDVEAVVPADGTEHDFAVDPGFGIHPAEVTDASNDYGVTFRQLDMRVPEAMARAVLAQLEREESDLDYIVASTPSSEGQTLQWLLYLKHGRIRDRVWRANGDGSNLRRNGT